MFKDYVRKTLLIAFLFVGIFLSFKPAVLVLTQSVAKKHFAIDRLSIGSVEFRSYKEIAFEDIRAEKTDGLVFAAQEISLHLRFLANSVRNILKIAIKSASLGIKYPDKNVADFVKREFRDGAQKTLFLDLECLGFDLNAEFKDLKLVSRFSIYADLASEKVNSLHLGISWLDYQRLRLENVLLLAQRDNSPGYLTIAKIKYDKVMIRELQSSARFENKNLIFDDLSAKVFNGNIVGDLIISLVVLPGYETRLQFRSLDLKRFVEDLELENKFTVTGSLSGNISLKGQGAVVKALGGDFTTDVPGGRLIIKDASFLDHIAYRASLDTVVESLQDYNYNTGAVNLSLEGGDLLADIHLDGKQGKRDFVIVLHH